MESPIVTLNDGKVSGYQMRDLNGESFYSFLGIPYAKPPVGDLRFKAPCPVEPWTDVKDGTKEGDLCFQKDEFSFAPKGSEDCLYLNVFTKTLPIEDSELKPVMVWIHGGGFVTGSSRIEMYGPEHLLTEDIVLVTLNYRVGLLGFLKLEDPSLEVFGNAGLKDQQLALKWVQKNIKFFNGDPNNVTIFGESAGSASVHFQILAKSSKGLFHKAIMQSGAVLNPWTLSAFPTLKFAQSIKEDIKTDYDILDMLKNMSVEELLIKQEEFITVTATHPFGLIAPTIETPNKTAILTAPPIEILHSGEYNKVPMLLGYNNGEGMLFEAFKLIKEQLGLKKPMKEPPIEEYVHSHMDLDENDPKRNIIVSKYKEFYFQGKNLSTSYMLIADYMFNIGILASAKLHVKTSNYPVYLYIMSLEAGRNLGRIASKIQEPGVQHADELGYLFNASCFPGQEYGDIENQAIRRFVKLWTNLAKFGNPTPDENDLNVTWTPVSEDELNYLDIGRELILCKDPEKENLEFWKEIFGLSPATAHYL